MRLAIIGAGIQARAILDDFVRFSDAERIGIADIEGTRARAVAAELGDVRVAPATLDVRDGAACTRWLAEYDAAISAVPYRFNAGLARAAIRARCHFTDLGGNNDVVAEELSLDAEARAAGVRIVPDLGLAPGMVALLGADLVRGLEPPRTLHMRVGGLPRHPEWPLDYRLFFAVGGLINEYVEPCRVIRAGRSELVEGLSELEELSFPEPFGALEAFQTSGGTSTLIDSLAGEVEELTYKTIRYPGHCRQMRLLRALGFFSSAPVRTDADGGGSTSVSPRSVTERLFREHLSEVVPDVVLVRITATGERDGARVRIVEEILDEPDAERGLSAMARTTGYPAAIVTELLGRGEIAGAGAEPQESCVPVPRFREELARRAIAIAHREEVDGSSGN